MPMVPVVLRPGVQIQATPLVNESGVSDSNLIRYKDGFLQKLGGCSRLTNTPMIGTARGMKAWADLAGNAYVGVGSNQRLMVYNTQQLYDITPQLQIDNLTTPFSTVMGSNVVTVTDGSFTPAVGDWIAISTMSFVGGIMLQGNYQVQSVGSGTYTINASTIATSTVAAGGAVLNFNTTNGSTQVVVSLASYVFSQYQVILITVSTSVGGVTLQGSYQVTIVGGVPMITASGAATSNASTHENSSHVQVIYSLASLADNTGFGYGDGAYSAGAYGLSIAGYNTLRQWSLDNWGQNLVASYTGGPPYAWVPPLGASIYNNPAALITPAVYTSNYVPWTTAGLFVAMPQQQLVIYGTDVTLVAAAGSASMDPMLVRFSDVADYTSWFPTATNQAGSFRLPSGSKIIGALQSPLQALIFTDIELWSMQYIGFPLVYGFTKIGLGCGLISQRAVAKMGTVTYWMSQQGFFKYDGSTVTPVRCSVWDRIWNGTEKSEIVPSGSVVLDTRYLDNVFAAPNSYFNEIAWYYPTVGSNSVVTNYVKYNVLDGVWDVGVLSRTDWIDQSILGAPIAVDGAGILQQHETDTDMDGQAMNSFALTGWFRLAETQIFMSIERILPDFIITPGSAIYIYVQVADYVNDATTTYGPYPVTSTTEYFIVKARGRVARLLIQSTGRSLFWRLGKPEMLVTQSGRR